MNKKIKISVLIIITSILTVLGLWKWPVTLTLVLLAVTYLKHRFSPIKKELLMYIISAVLGAGSESLIMLSGPWSYANSQIFNFPVWLPFLWGLAGITGITLYEGLLEDKKRTVKLL